MESGWLVNSSDVNYAWTFSANVGDAVGEEIVFANVVGSGNSFDLNNGAASFTEKLITGIQAYFQGAQSEGQAIHVGFVGISDANVFFDIIAAVKVAFENEFSTNGVAQQLGQSHGDQKSAYQ